MAQIVIPVDYPRAKSLDILSKFANYEATIVQEADAVIPTLKVNGSIVTMSIPAIARVMFAKQKGMFGEGNSENTAFVQQYIELSESIAEGVASVDIKTFLGQIMNQIKTRRFIVGDSLSIADILMFLALEPYISSMKKEDIQSFSECIRWFEHINFLMKYPVKSIDFPFIEYVHKAKADTPKEPKGEAKSGPQQKREPKPKEEKPKVEKPKPAPKPVEPVEELDAASYLDVRVGRIVKVWPHPNADSLFCEEIDVGNGQIKKVVTGVRNYYSVEQMQDRIVIVFCNIKPSKIRDMPSEGMVFAASNEDHTVVELLEAPAGAAVGTRVLFGDFCKSEPHPVDKNGKLWKAAVEFCKIDEEGKACYKGQPLHTPQGVCTVPNLRKCEFH